MIRTSKYADGFTLLEIMIVVLIMSIVTGLAAFMTTHILHSRKISGFAKRLASTLPAVGQQAVLRSQTLGVYFGEKTIECYGYSPNNKLHKPSQTTKPKIQGPWILLQRSPLGHSLFIPANVRLHLHIDQGTKQTAKEHKKFEEKLIVFDSNGELSPFYLEIGDRDRYNFRLTGQANAAITLTKHS